MLFSNGNGLKKITSPRVLLISSLVIATAGVVLGLLGAWPTLLGEDLMDGGGTTATVWHRRLR